MWTSRQIRDLSNSWGIDTMDKLLAAIMEQLNQISVQGDDVERMYAVKQMIRRIQDAVEAARAAEKTE